MGKWRCRCSTCLSAGIEWYDVFETRLPLPPTSLSSHVLACQSCFKPTFHSLTYSTPIPVNEAVFHIRYTHSQIERSLRLLRTDASGCSASQGKQPRAGFAPKSLWMQLRGGLGLTTPRGCSPPLPRAGCACAFAHRPLPFNYHRRLHCSHLISPNPDKRRLNTAKSQGRSFGIQYHDYSYLALGCPVAEKFLRVSQSISKQPSHNVRRPKPKE